MVAATGGDEIDVGVVGEQEIVDLVTLLDDVTERMAALDGGAWSGASPSAEENRTIGEARARLARQQALGMRADLDDVRQRAADLMERTLAVRESRRQPGRGWALGTAEADAAPATREDPAVAALRAAADLVDVHDEDDVLARVVAGAVRAVPAARWSSVTMFDASGASTVRRAGSPAISVLENRQRHLGLGPVPDALADSSEPVVVGDLGSDRRWPQLAAEVRDAGVRGVVAVALPGRRVRGVLAVYAETPRVLDAASGDAACVFAGYAAIALAGARRVSGLNRALESRDVIGQAKGILAQRDGLTPDEAFARLVRASQHANLKVVDVARWMVEEGRVASPPAP